MRATHSPFTEAMVMIAIPVVLLAAFIGVVLAAVDGPYPHDKARIERLSFLLLVAGALTMTGGGVYAARGLLFD
ncbi:hypothetical protein [Actinoplanes sp. NPDC026623]|uniref:hypothetical protein n=1 Tax=Actinoplanes sp. NPDC026623 TaxID=3155610 RepID=UPI0033FC7570